MNEDEVSDDTRREIREQTRAQKRAAKALAEQAALEPDPGPRAAKKNAIANASWFEAEHKRRPDTKGKRAKPGKAPEPVQDTGKKHKRGPSSTKDSQSKTNRGSKTKKKKQDRPSSDSEVEDSELSPSEEEHQAGKRPKKAPTNLPANYREQSPPVESEGSSESYDGSQDGSDDEEDDDDEALGNMEDHELQELIGSEVPRGVSSKEGSRQRSASRSSGRRSVRRSESPSFDAPATRTSSRSSSRRSESPVQYRDTAASAGRRSPSFDAPAHIAPSRRSSRASSRRSGSPVPYPPRSSSPSHLGTSESDGMVMKNAKKPSQKMSMKPTKREEIFRNERPDIVAQPINEDRYLSKKALRKKARAAPSLTSVPQIHEDTSGTVDMVPKDDWPAHAQLRGNNLKEQNTLIRELCRDAIKIVHTTLVTTHAWPELNRLAEYRREVLNTAGRALQKTDSRFADIRARIKKDDKFAMVIGKLVIDRLASVRGPVRIKGLDHIAIFQLGVGEICVERVQALVAGDTYIYPGSWTTDDNHKQFWFINKKEIYLNAGLIEVLKSAFFATPTSFGYKFTEFYKSSHSTRTEPELTASLVALAATGLYAGLHAWQTGVKVDNEKFEGDTFKAVYERHLGYLKSIKEQNPTAYHVLMAKLYSKVIDTDASATNANNIQGSAFAVADLSEFI